MAKSTSVTMEGPDSYGFPGAGIDLIQHEVRVNLFQVKDKREFRLETLNFNGRMIIERGEPYTNKSGIRQIDFIVKSWVATAWSKVLKQEFVYILSPDKEQPVSNIIAQQKDKDFPAQIQFNVIFDARANNRLIKREHHGRPEGKNFMSIPPAEEGDIKLAATITTFGNDDIIDVLIALNGPRIDIMPFDDKNANQPKGRVLHLRVKPYDCHDKHGRTMVSFVDLEFPPGLPPEITQLMSEIPLIKDQRLFRKKD